MGDTNPIIAKNGDFFNTNLTQIRVASLSATGNYDRQLRRYVIDVGGHPSEPGISLTMAGWIVKIRERMDSYRVPRCVHVSSASSAVSEKHDSMPRIPRMFVFDPTEVDVYHCINRCVRYDGPQ